MGQTNSKFEDEIDVKSKELESSFPDLWPELTKEQSLSCTKMMISLRTFTYTYHSTDCKGYDNDPEEICCKDVSTEQERLMEAYIKTFVNMNVYDRLRTISYNKSSSMIIS
jgi:hypothetical protein